MIMLTMSEFPPRLFLNQLLKCRLGYCWRCFSLQAIY